MALDLFPSEPNPLNKLAAQSLLDIQGMSNTSSSIGTQEPFSEIQGSAHLPTLIAFPVIRDIVNATIRGAN